MTLLLSFVTPNLLLSYNGLRLTGRKLNGDVFSVANTPDRSDCLSCNRNAFALRVEARVRRFEALSVGIPRDGR